jgi:hypothetical protein
MKRTCSVTGLALFQGTSFLLKGIPPIYEESVTYVPGLFVTNLPGLYQEIPSPLMGEGEGEADWMAPLLVPRLPPL